ncbi:non-heme iron oxygenase ferredoxin subunit [Microbacteriaceae bacterium K1510]|nr:non-heme iron oxygenase ferredoxin subunit [Microbacteriaceae bacterium K1510]
MLDTLTRLIDAADVPQGEGRMVRIDGLERVAVFNVEGRFFVTQDACSHAKASLTKGWLEGFEVCCPVHAGRFDVRTGLALCFPATEPIKTFPSELRDGAVWADLSQARKR